MKIRRGTVGPEVAADVLANRRRPIRYLVIGRFVLLWEAVNAS